MTREQARTYLKCSGMSEEQIDTVEKAFTGVIEDIKAEIEFERDRKIGGEFFEAVQYKSFNKCLEIIDKHIGG